MPELGSFADLANTKLGDVEKPKPIPKGHYQAMFAGNFAEHKSSGKGTLAARFPVTLVAPMEDVNQEMLAEAGGLKPDRKHNLDFWITPDSLWRLKEFGQAYAGASDELGVVETLNTFHEVNEPFVVEVDWSTPRSPEDVPFVQVQNPVALKTYEERQASK